MPCPTLVARLMAGRTRSTRSVRSATGISLPPSWPTRAVVIPCRSCVAASGDLSSPPSACECMSMKPGLTMRPAASMTRSLARGVSEGPTSTMTSPSMRTSAGREGLPVPSTRRPFRISSPLPACCPTTATEPPRASNETMRVRHGFICFWPLRHRETQRTRPRGASVTQPGTRRSRVTCGSETAGDESVSNRRRSRLPPLRSRTTGRCAAGPGWVAPSAAVPSVNSVPLWQQRVA